MRKFLYLAYIILLFNFKAKTQSLDSCLREVNFEVHSIIDLSNGNTPDTISFIISKNDGERKPLLLFLQGSGNGSLIFSGKEGVFTIFSSIAKEKALRNYHCVLISKPYTKLVDDLQRANILQDSTRGNLAKFRDADKIETYVNQSFKVINYLKSLKQIDSSKVFVIGHSQGYDVAARLAAQHPKLIAKVVCVSSNPFDRENGVIRQLRFKAMIGQLSDSIVQCRIDSIYQQYASVKEYVEMNMKNKQMLIGDSKIFYNDYSFNYSPRILDLIKITSPLLIVYGINDIQSIDNDIVPLFFIRAGKTNLTMKPYFGCDHNFFYRKYDNAGNLIEEHYKWPEVFDFISKWLLN